MEQVTSTQLARAEADRAAEAAAEAARERAAAERTQHVGASAG